MALLVVPLVARMQAEEALLGEHFGEAYAAYRARSGGSCRGSTEANGIARDRASPHFACRSSSG